MESKNVLALLVNRALTTGEESKLSKDDLLTFHRQFEEKVSPTVEKLREEKRRANDKVRDIAFW